MPHKTSYMVHGLKREQAQKEEKKEKESSSFSSTLLNISGEGMICDTKIEGAAL